MAVGQSVGSDCSLSCTPALSVTHSPDAAAAYCLWCCISVMPLLFCLWWCSANCVLMLVSQPVQESCTSTYLPAQLREVYLLDRIGPSSCRLMESWKRWTTLELTIRCTLWRLVLISNHFKRTSERHVFTSSVTLNFNCKNATYFRPIKFLFHSCSFLYEVKR